MEFWRIVLIVFLVAADCLTGLAEEKPITRIWLSHRSADPNLVVVNWETANPGDSTISFSVGNDIAIQPAKSDAETSSIKRAEIRIPQRNQTVRYTVRTGDQQAEAAFATFPKDEPLRVAIVADWQGRPRLDALLNDKIHILATAGDNVPSLHGRCGVGVKDCTQPFGELIDAYRELFRSVRFMPALGNHDREVRPRGNTPPAEPVYDVEATAYRKFFALPGDEWKWHLDLAEFGLRLVALDLNHIQDQGTTWQTCHAFGRDSEQFRWFDQLTSEENQPPFTVVLHNEKSGAMRAQEKLAWHEMFRRTTLAVTGFGYFAERAEVDGFSYYNTALGAGAKYPDSKSVFFESTPSYLLLQVSQQKLLAELKALDGRVLESREFRPRQ